MQLVPEPPSKRRRRSKSRIIPFAVSKSKFKPVCGLSTKFLVVDVNLTTSLDNFTDKVT